MGGLNHKGSYSGMLARTEQRADCVGQARRNLGTTGDLNHKGSYSGMLVRFVITAEIGRARYTQT